MNTNEEYDLLSEVLTVLSRQEPEEMKATAKKVGDHLLLMQTGMGEANLSTKYHSRCLHKAKPDEPLFVLRANDITAPALVRRWAEINHILQPADKTGGAERLAEAMEVWHATNVDTVTKYYKRGNKNDSVDAEISKDEFVRLQNNSSYETWMIQGSAHPQPSPLQVQSHHEAFTRFVCQKWKDQEPVAICETTGNIAKDGTPLNIVFMGMIGSGELTDEHFKRFVDKINICIEAGDIEYGSLAPMMHLPICDTKEPIPVEDASKFLGEAQMGAMISNSRDKKIVNYFQPTYEQNRWVLLFYPASRFTTQQLKAKYKNLFNEEGALPEEEGRLAGN